MANDKPLSEAERAGRKSVMAAARAGHKKVTAKLPSGDEVWFFRHRLDVDPGTKVPVRRIGQHRGPAMLVTRATLTVVEAKEV